VCISKINYNNEWTLVVSETVDDCASTGNEKDIDWFMDALENRFKITRDGEISDHLGVFYGWGADSNSKHYCKATVD